MKIKINKKVIIPIVSSVAAVCIVFIAIAFTGNRPEVSQPDTGASNAVSDATVQTEASCAKEQSTLKMSFIGDCVIGGDPVNYGEGSFIWYSENYPLSYFFENVKSVLEKDDFTLANLECVLSDNLELQPVDKGYEPAFWFMAKAKNAQILTEGSVEVAGVVNNHTYDYGDEGYADTVKALKAQGLLVGEDCSPIYFEKNGIKVGVVYANLWAYYQVNDITEALEQMQDTCDYKIVFFHGGEEGQHEPDNFKIDACRDLAESGLCDLIVGSHPHVLQPLEVVNGVPILYSLGNFCYSANNYPENKTVIFGVTLQKDESGNITAQTEITPCYVYIGDCNAFQPTVITDEADKKEILDMMSAKVDYITESYEEAQQTEATDEPELSEDSYYEENTLWSEALTDAEQSEPEQDLTSESSEEEELSENNDQIETAISYY